MNKFSIAVPFRTSYYNDYAVVLSRQSLLRRYILGARRGCPGVPEELLALNPAIGFVRTLAGKFLSTYRGESVRFATYPWFDRWALKKIVPPDHLISSYGFANASFQTTRARGGKTFLEAGNSHPQQFWDILTEEHARWGCELPPVWPSYHARALRTLEQVDFVLSPSRYVSDSFLRRGFASDQIIYNPFASDFSHFRPSERPRPKNRPFTLIHTGMVGLRKGSPYLLEAFRQVRKQLPTARLVMVRQIHDSIKPILPRFQDLPIEWSEGGSHPALANLLRDADLFVMPTLEEGFARVLAEALACGLPVITTAHAGVNDCIIAGENGEVVPLRDVRALTDAILKWAEKILTTSPPPRSLIDPDQFSLDAFERRFMGGIRQLEAVGKL